MENIINTETLHALISLYKGDTETMEIITASLNSFEKYHQAVYKLEIQLMLYTLGAMDTETYRVRIPDLDSVRTRNHNVLISEVRLLNRLAEQNGLPPFYGGPVSEQSPVRTQVADAVFAFVSKVIEDRVTGGR